MIYNTIIYLADNSRLQLEHEATIAHLQSELKTATLKCSHLEQEGSEAKVKLMITTTQV